MGLCEMGTLCWSENGDSDGDFQRRISQMGWAAGGIEGSQGGSPYFRIYGIIPSLSGCVWE